MPCRSIRVDPRVVTSPVSSLSRALVFLSIAPGSPASSTASRRRVLPARSRGLTVAISARACRADRNFPAPPGSSSSSSRCSRPATWVRAWPSSSRRSASMPITTRSSPGPDLDQARRAQGGQRDGVRAGRVGLAAVASGEHPHLRGQLRRHAGDGLAVMDQAVRQVPADAVAALHRPDPVRERPRRGQHFRIPGLVRAVPARRQHYCPLIDDLDRGRALVRVHPDDHAHRFLLG